jgi:hypothetical protein
MVNVRHLVRELIPWLQGLWCPECRRAAHLNRIGQCQLELTMFVW